ncbi:MAG: hypothetical protein AB1938_00635 [Myxococcota bacterium]
MHLYLQRGRIAWGTTSTDRFLFRRLLVSRCGIDERALREVVQEGLRTRRPLGETLVSWGLATAEQVSDALKAQVAATVLALRRCPTSTQTLFLPRGPSFSEYDVKLTFDLADFGPTEQPLSPSPWSLLEHLRASVADCTWGAVLSSSGAPLALWGKMPAEAGVVARRLGADADLIVLRASTGALVAGTVGDERVVMLGLPAEAGVTTAFHVVEVLVDRLVPSTPACARGAFEHFGDLEGELQGVEQILERAVCPVGAVVLEGTGIGALAREPLSPAELGEVAAIRQSVLAADVFRVHEATQQWPPAFQVALVGDNRWWWFGTELPSSRGRSVWLALPRATSQSIGWALLSTLARQLLPGERRDD